MLDQIAANQVGAVFAANVSRLSRQLLDFESFRVLAAYHRVLLMTDGRVIDPADTNDTVLVQVSATIFQFENRKRAQVMREARITKARQGVIVSLLPVGWVLGPDQKYEYDPAVKDVIDLVIATFWKTRLDHDSFAVQPDGMPFRLTGSVVQFSIRTTRFDVPALSCAVTAASNKASHALPTAKRQYRHFSDPRFVGRYETGQWRRNEGC
jgi:hypothetical protein